MNFKGHLIGGTATGAIVAVGAVASGYVSVNAQTLSGFFENPWSTQNDVFTLAALFFVALFMSLFPDLDIASIPQRWFLRTSFILLAFLFFYENMEWFAILTFLTLLPLLHKHRGWTHFKIAPFIISFIAAIVFARYRDYPSGANNFSWELTFNLLKDNWMYVSACVFGHYTHLFLDYWNKRI